MGGPGDSGSQEALSGIVARPLNKAIRFEWANLKQLLHNRFFFVCCFCFLLFYFYFAFCFFRRFSLVSYFVLFLALFFFFTASRRSASNTSPCVLCAVIAVVGELFYCYWPVLGAVCIGVACF